MQKKEMGVREAARIAGVGPSTIVSWRSGALPEDYLAVKRLAKALGTTLGFLLTGEED
jgi:transcriptional regulator with XRE-family HTH domain